VSAADQGRRSAGGERRSPFSFSFCSTKASIGRQRRLAERLEGPVGLHLLGIDARLRGARGARIGRAALHPGLEVGDLLGGEPLLGRHLEVVVGRSGSP
jgi:hypothetical protein